MEFLPLDLVPVVEVRLRQAALQTRLAIAIKKH
jgi:hypothetical protein